MLLNFIIGKDIIQGRLLILRRYKKYGWRHNEMNSYKCVIADKDLIIKKWDCEIKKHNNSKLWIQFKKESLKNLDTRIVYMGLLNGEIITEATAIVSEYDFNMQNKDGLIGDKKAYLTAFRTNKEYENKGYFSKLYKFMENDLKKRGFKYLTLGVEPCEIRNIQIYFKWGFIKYIKTDYEYYSSSEKVIVNYYEKTLK
jgi:ribosomal protein S18 acetylase RimI-like enzyme